MAESKYLYIMNKKKGSLIKIGIAKDPDKRASALRLASGDDITVVYKRWVRDARGVEKALHKHFRAKRKEGEFFCMEYHEAIKVAEECINAVVALEEKADYINYCEGLSHEELYMYDRAHSKLGLYSYFEFLNGIRYYVQLRGDFVSDNFEDVKLHATYDLEQKIKKLTKDLTRVRLAKTYTQYMEFLNE